MIMILELLIHILHSKIPSPKTSKHTMIECTAYDHCNGSLFGFTDNKYTRICYYYPLCFTKSYLPSLNCPQITATYTHRHTHTHVHIHAHTRTHRVNAKLKLTSRSISQAWGFCISTSHTSLARLLGR